jgi:flagellar biosynthesis protein FlhB
MCKMVSEVVQKRTLTEWRSSVINEGFGASDFFNALAHPFKFKVSLFFGALMFMVFSLGQSASSLGGIYMMVAGLFSMMFANMLTFGILSNTVESFAQGKLDSNFMPDFEDFELWDTVIHPFFLSIGAYLSAFGPLLLVLAIGFYVVVSSVTSQMETFQQDVEKIPGTHYYDSERVLDQSETVKGVIGNVNRAQQERLDQLNALAESEDEDATPGEVVEEDQSRRESREQEELWAMAQDQRAKSFEAALGKSPETQAKERDAMMQNFLSLAPPLVVIGAIFFLWGLFYFPAACAVAGYTRTFSATINPLVGLDTIKRLGSTYVAILFMGLILLIASVVVGFVFAVALSAFDLPGFGNLPAKALGAIFSFYLWIVFSCILGYAIFKRSDALQIQTS